MAQTVTVKQDTEYRLNIKNGQMQPKTAMR